jgi:Na+-driven multidrug efflux pump
VGKLRISIYTAIIAIVSNIPLSIYFAKNLDLGSFGVILATCVSFLPGTVLLSIQAYKLAYNNESGIWNK